MRLVNTRTGRALASALEMADTRAARRKGLLGRDRLEPGSALMLTPCNAVHTVGMRFPIDVVFVDGRGRVRKIVRELPPWRMAASPLSRATIELPAGRADAEALLVGDRVVSEP